MFSCSWACYCNSEAPHQKLAIKNQIFAVFTSDEKHSSENQKGKNPPENLLFFFLSLKNFSYDMFNK